MSPSQVRRLLGEANSYFQSLKSQSSYIKWIKDFFGWDALSILTDEEKLFSRGPLEWRRFQKKKRVFEQSTKDLTLPITPSRSKTRDGSSQARSRKNSSVEQSNGEGEEEDPDADDHTANGEHVAIVGVGCRFPGGVSTAEAFWEMLEDQVDAVRRIPTERWEAQQFQQAKVASQLGGFLGANEVENFDSDFFGIANNEADLLDPQQRFV